LVETPKQTGNKLRTKINSEIRQNKMQRIFYMEIAKLRCGDKIVFYSSIQQYFAGG